MSQQIVADAFRDVAAVISKRIESGERCLHVDARDLTEVLLSVADRIDPETLPAPVAPDQSPNDSFQVGLSLPVKTVRGLLCSALEGGANYWHTVSRYSFAPGVAKEDFIGKGRFVDPEVYWHPTQLIPFAPGCAVEIAELDEDESKQKVHRLDREAMQRGLQVMLDKYPHHFADVLKENADAETGDVFLQCCLLGELVYG